MGLLTKGLGHTHLVPKIAFGFFGSGVAPVSGDIAVMVVVRLAMMMVESRLLASQA